VTKRSIPFEMVSGFSGGGSPTASREDPNIASLQSGKKKKAYVSRGGKKNGEVLSTRGEREVSYSFCGEVCGKCFEHAVGGKAPPPIPEGIRQRGGEKEHALQKAYPQKGTSYPERKGPDPRGAEGKEGMSSRLREEGGLLPWQGKNGKFSRKKMRGTMEGGREKNHR